MNENTPYIEQSYDKFEDKATTLSVPEKIILKEFWSKDKLKSRWSLGIRHVKTKNIDSLLIDGRFFGEDWFFLRDGYIIFLTTEGPIKLEPIVGNTNVGGGGKVTEYESYEISKEDFLKICESEVLDIKISGDKSFVQIDDAKDFALLCRKFYNNFYDSNKYVESLETSSNLKGYFILALIVLIAVSLIYYFANSTSTVSKIDTSISSTNVDNLTATVISTNGLNLRDTPNSAGKLLMKIPKNSKVTVLNKDGREETISGKKANWYQIKYNEAVGWGWSGFLQMGN